MLPAACSASPLGFEQLSPPHAPPGAPASPRTPVGGFGPLIPLLSICVCRAAKLLWVDNAQSSVIRTPAPCMARVGTASGSLSPRRLTRHRAPIASRGAVAENCQG